MKRIFLVPILFLSFWFTESKDLDLCKNNGPQVAKYSLAIKRCMLDHLKDTGEEGKTKKCAKDFVYKGAPGHEADKEHCKANNLILVVAMKCLFDHSDGMKDNEPLRECFNKIPPLPDGDYGPLAELIKSFAKKVPPSI